MILVPQPGIKPVPPAVEALSPNHCTAREVLQVSTQQLMWQRLHIYIY